MDIVVIPMSDGVTLARKRPATLESLGHRGDTSCLTRKTRDAVRDRGRTGVGELLRRYWMPIAAVSELDQQPVVPVRILGEDLVLYKDGHGSYGLLERWCPHRRFDLAFGTIEECGLRCSYHGWRFNEAGACLEQPFEDAQNPSSTFKESTRTKAHRVQLFGGLIWAYLGPEPAPLLPDWAGFYTPGYTIVSFLQRAV